VLRKYTTEFWVGLFTLVSLLIAVYMVFRTGDLRLERQPGYRVVVNFPDVAGLDVGDTVRVAGVEVGKVESIDLEENQGRVTLRIDHRAALYQDATAQVETYGLLGDRYISIKAGHSNLPRVEPGGEIGSAVSPAQLDVLLGKLSEVASDIKTVTTTLKRVLGGAEGEQALREILVNTRDLSEELVRTVRENQEDFRRITKQVATLTLQMEDMVAENREAVHRTLAAMPETAENVREITGRARELLTAHQQDISETLENLRVASAQLEESLKAVEDLSQKVRSGEGTLGKLIQDDALYEEATKTLREARNLIEDLREQAPISAFIAVGGAALP
jgi:phospholipid/cholesterol/gamma-HCH transport system substrate-binding protein